MSLELLIAVFFFAYSILATYFCIKFAVRLIKIQDSVESSLDTIDDCYAEISRILEIPVYYDSNEVRSVLDAIKETQNAVHKVAVSLSENFDTEEKS